MTVLTENLRPGEFIISEANGTRSRDVVTIDASAGAMVPGTVIAKLVAGGKYVAYVESLGTDGSEIAAGILCAAVDDSASDQQAVIISRDAEVLEICLTGLDSVGKADLAALGIIVR
jgi:hypothetical protein